MNRALEQALFVAADDRSARERPSWKDAIIQFDLFCFVLFFDLGQSKSYTGGPGNAKHSHQYISASALVVDAVKRTSVCHCGEALAITSTRPAEVR